MFGNKTIHGGMIGSFIDSAIRTLTFRRTLHQRNQQLEELGYHLPKLTQQNVNQRGIPVMTQTYLAEILLRSSARRNAQEEAEKYDKCLGGGIPNWILQPNSGDWYRPFVVTTTNSDSALALLEFEEYEMRKFMASHFPSLPDNNVPVWGLCALYWYGGYFVASSVKNSNALQDFQQMIPSSRDRCADTAAAIFHGADLYMIKATPRHPLIACAIRKLGNAPDRNTISFPFALVVGEEEDSTSLVSGKWFDSYCSDAAVECCSLRETNESSSSGGIYLQVLDEQMPEQENQQKERHQDPRVLVEVRERSNVNQQLQKKPKEAIGKVLASSNCEAGWLCNRCLKTSWYGTFGACSAVCRSCYINIICNKNSMEEYPKRTSVHIDVAVKEKYPLDHGEKRIPRIIHQTWFEEITADRYPHMIRLQKSWKSSGWEYRFYTDKTATEYIQNHFPDRFVEVFDALIPGAFKVR
jgi:hypothetical protein